MKSGISIGVQITAGSPILSTKSYRTGPDRTVPDRTGPDRTGPDRTVAYRSVP
jgi:hypothetical protein